MCVLGAQELKLMRCEIDNQNAPARLQHTDRFTQRGLRIIEEVQDLMKEHRIKAASRLTVGKRKAIDIAAANLTIERAGLTQPIARIDSISGLTSMPTPRLM